MPISCTFWVQKFIMPCLSVEVIFSSKMVIRHDFVHFTYFLTFWYMIYYLTHLNLIQGYFYQSRKIICITQQLEESKRNVFTLCGISWSLDLLIMWISMEAYRVRCSQMNSHKEIGFLIWGWKAFFLLWVDRSMEEVTSNCQFS